MLLDQALSPALGFLRTGSTAERVAAATLLGNIAEGRRGAAIFLVAEGALPDAVGLLVKGGWGGGALACEHANWLRDPQTQINTRSMAAVILQLSTYVRQGLALEEPGLSDSLTAGCLVTLAQREANSSLTTPPPRCPQVTLKCVMRVPTWCGPW